MTDHMIRIVICDDHAIVRDGLKRMIEAETDMIVAAEADDGQTVLHLIRDGAWDVLLLDISMTGMSGLETLRRIRSRYGMEQKHVLILTQYDENHIAREFFKAGASGYLTKMEAGKELVPAIRSIIRGERYVTPNMSN